MKDRFASWRSTLGTLSILGVLSACSTLDVAPRGNLDPQARWAMLPFTNHTETPQAGSRAAAIVEAVLRTRGVMNLERAPQPDAETLFDPAPQSIEKSLAWARNAGVRYALTGTVSEWRYKVGVDGEPAVGLTLQAIEVASGKVVWSASGGRSGFSREALSAVAQKLARDLTAPLAGR
jgi:TolB-like protein